MLCQVGALETRAQGYPPLALSIEAEVEAWSPFPSPGIVALIGDVESSLPALSVRWVPEVPLDARGLGVVVLQGAARDVGVEGAAVVGWGEVSVSSRRCRAVAFRGRRPLTQVPVTGFAAAILPTSDAVASERGTALLVVSVPEDASDAPTPEMLARLPSVARLLAGFRLDFFSASAPEKRRTARMMRRAGAAEELADGDAPTARMGTPVETALSAIDALSELVGKAANEPGLDPRIAEPRRLLHEQLEIPREHARSFVHQGYRRPPVHYLSMVVAKVAGVAEDDPLAPRVEDALTLIVQLLEPQETRAGRRLHG